MPQTSLTNPPPAIGRKRPAIPFWLKAVAILGIIASWLPLVLVALGRVSISTEPRIHLVQDMGRQPKYREQNASDLFADGRADRPAIDLTVARGHLDEDDAFYRGFTRNPDPQTAKPAITFVPTLPPPLQLTPSLLARGQDRFNIYCTVCHGLDGHGQGRLAVRARELQEIGGVSGWVPPADLHSPLVRGRADGHIFNTITNGIRTMPAYGAQIPVADRWAIVAYIRALQFSQHAPAKVIPPSTLQTLR